MNVGGTSESEALCDSQCESIYGRSSDLRSQRRSLALVAEKGLAHSLALAAREVER